jgi:hypothetical protein
VFKINPIRAVFQNTLANLTIVDAAVFAVVKEDAVEIIEAMDFEDLDEVEAIGGAEETKAPMIETNEEEVMVVARTIETIVEDTAAAAVVSIETNAVALVEVDIVVVENIAAVDIEEDLEDHHVATELIALEVVVAVVWVVLAAAVVMFRKTLTPSSMVVKRNLRISTATCDFFC